MKRLFAQFAAAVAVLTGCILLHFAACRYFYTGAYPLRYMDAISAYSGENDLPPALVLAVIRTESGFRPQVQSSIGARGLMQLTEETFDWVKHRTHGSETFPELFVPETNIQYGSALLRLLLDEFGTTENALIAYHAGWGNAQNWLADPRYSADGVTIDRIPFADTAYYVDKVMRTNQVYNQLYDFEQTNAQKG